MVFEPIESFVFTRGKMSELFPKHDHETDDDSRLKDIKSKISSLKAVNPLFEFELFYFYFSDFN